MAVKFRTDGYCESLWLIYDNRKIGFILQKQQKSKKEVTTWRATLNFILIGLAVRVIVYIILLWPEIVNRLLARLPVQNF